MKIMPAGAFKVHCLAVMDEVQARRESVVITKHGKPVAKLVPADQNADDIYDFLARKGAIVDDRTMSRSSSQKMDAENRIANVGQKHVSLFPKRRAIGIPRTL